MRSEFKDGKLYLHRTNKERDPLLTRLRRLEGQARGLQQMIQDDRYCGDEIQQGEAIMAAVREVMRLLIDQHVSAGISSAIDGAISKDDVMRDIEKILRSDSRVR